MAVTAEEKKRVKAMGFLPNRDGEHVSARIITVNGVMNAEQMRNLSEAALKFGNGQIALTSRMTLELPGVKYEDIPAFQEFVARENMVTGGTGAKVRPLVSCKGTVCVFGLIDTQALTQELHELFYEGYRSVTLPHKFKIAVGGCPNNCVKPDLNDVGIVGQRVPAFDREKCRGCKKCVIERTCPMKASKVEDGKLVMDPKVCNSCGRCVTKCPFGAIPDGTVGYRVYVGGRWGKQVRHGDKLSPLFTKEEAVSVVEKAILLFKSEGKAGERFGSMVDRLGLEKVERTLVANGLLARKEEILNMEVAAG